MRKIIIMLGLIMFSSVCFAEGENIDIQDHIVRQVEQVQSQRIEGNSNSNLANGGFVVKYDNVIYYANVEDNSKLYSYNLETKFHIKLTDNPVRCLNVINDKLLFSEHIRNAGSNAYCMNLDGSEKKCLGYNDMYWIKANKDKVYISKGFSELYSWDYESESCEVVIKASLNTYHIVGDIMYYNRRYGREPGFCKLDLRTKKSGVIGRDFYGIATNEYVYSILSINDKNIIERRDLDCSRESTKQILVESNKKGMENLHIDGKYGYYFRNSKYNGLIRVDLDTGETKKVLKFWKYYRDESLDINVVDSEIYFISSKETGKAYIYRVDQNTMEAIKIEKPSDLVS